MGLTKKIKEKIFERDNYRCKACGMKICLEVHHMLSKEYGGSDKEDNLITLCKWCKEFAPDDGKEENELFIKDKYEYIFKTLNEDEEYYNKFIIYAKENNMTLEEAKEYLIDSIQMDDYEDFEEELEKERKRRKKNRKKLEDIEVETEEQLEIFKVLMENNWISEEEINEIEIELIDKYTITIENLCGTKFQAKYEDGDVLIKECK